MNPLLTVLLPAWFWPAIIVGLVAGFIWSVVDAWKESRS